ncbi:hypothetical protein CAEBREN_17190 [Caenorhabditis brenneri]|uniref:Uncharacterized protein n=1 Tax=Caenorhabditis brenneri TaxID=135651 RepID=G0MBZ4_CAEBE|nr:hypothetical protein CAEBREN_17190 [Caenorhabditis brenneri]
MLNQVQHVELNPIQEFLRGKDYEQKKQYFICTLPNESGKCGHFGTFSDLISHSAQHWHCHMFVCQVCSRQIYEYNEIYRHTDPANQQPCRASARQMTLNTSNRFGFVDLWKSRNVFISAISKGEYQRLKAMKKTGGGGRNTTSTPMYEEEDGEVLEVEDQFGYDNNNYNHKPQNQVNRNFGGGSGRNANLEPLGTQRRSSRVRFDDESPSRGPPGINPRGAYQNQRSQSRAPNSDYNNPPRGDYQNQQNRGRAGFGNANGGGGNSYNNSWNNRNSNGGDASNPRNRNKSRGREGSGDFGGGSAIRNRSPSDDFRTPSNRQPYADRRAIHSNPPDPRMNQGADSIYRNQNNNNRSPPPSGGRSSNNSSMFRSPTPSPAKRPESHSNSGFRSPTQSPAKRSESHSNSGFRSPTPSQNEPGSSNPQYSRSPPDYSRPPPPLSTRGAHRSPPPPRKNSATRNLRNPQQPAYRSPSPPRSEINPPAVHRSPVPQDEEGFRVYCSPPPQETPAATTGRPMTRSQLAAAGASQEPHGKATTDALKRKSAPIRTEESEERSGTIDLAIKKPDEMVRQRRSSINYRSISRGRSVSKGRDGSDDDQMKEIEKTRALYQIQGKSNVKVLHNTSRMSSLLSNPISSSSAKSRTNSLPPKKTAKLDRLRASILASTQEPEPPRTPLSTTFRHESVDNIPLPSPVSVSTTPPGTPGPSSSYSNPLKRLSTYRTPSPQPVPPPSCPPGISKRPRTQSEDDEDDVEIID